MASKHPKITVYIPKTILQALDDWKQVSHTDSRSEAIVTILEDYLGALKLVQYEEQQASAAPPRIRLSMLLDEIYELKERVVALEESISTANREAPSTVLTQLEESETSEVRQEAPNTVPPELAKLGDAPSNVPSTVVAKPEELEASVVPGEVPNTAPSELAKPGDVQSNVPTTALTQPASPPLAPLTQSALAKRLGCSDKAVEKQRKQGQESFIIWSRDRDPDGLAWTWEGRGGRGQPLKFVPLE
ncbi:ribbon-helix-helix domain-containing protein [Microcoleus sp. ZQ-A2]|nr:hypothetical protein [Microcoleus sp. FACHB-1]